MIPTVIQGVAMAFFFIPLVTITLSGLSPDRIPAASGLSNFARITAGAIGTSIATTRVGEPRGAAPCATGRVGQPGQRGREQRDRRAAARSGFSTEQVLAQINRLVDQQSFMLAANDVFYASAVLFLLLIPLVWLVQAERRRRRASRRGRRRALTSGTSLATALSGLVALQHRHLPQ